GGQQIQVVLPCLRTVEFDPFRREHRDRLAIQMEHDLFDAVQASQCECDLGEAAEHAETPATVVERSGQVDGGDSVGDLDAQHLHTFWNRGRYRGGALDLVGRGTGHQSLHHRHRVGCVDPTEHGHQV